METDTGPGTQVGPGTSDERDFWSQIVCRSVNLVGTRSGASDGAVGSHLRRDLGD